VDPTTAPQDAVMTDTPRNKSKKPKKKKVKDPATQIVDQEEVQTPQDVVITDAQPQRTKKSKK
jgi:hypothetical protein